MKTLIIALLLLAATTACAGRAPAPEAPADTGQPRSGGVIRTLLQYDITDLDPTGPHRQMSTTLVPLIYNTLLGTQTGPDLQWSDRNVVAELAEKWEVSPDAKTYTFHLRQGVKFADIAPVSGRELTSEDVAQSYHYWNRSGRFAEEKLPASRSKYMFEGMDRIETPDPYTVTVRFKDPFASFVSYMADDVVPIVPKELFDSPGGLKDNAIGSGPFQLDASGTVTGSRMVFRKNPGFWKPGQPYLDEVDLLILTGDAPKEAAFVARQLDVLIPPSDNAAKNVQRAHPQAKMMEGLGNGSHLTLNVRIPPLNDVRVRRAIALGIDRDEIIKTLYGGKGEWAIAGAPPGLFTQAEVGQVLKYDPEAARRLIQEVGGSVDVEWHWPQDYGDLYGSRVQLIQAQLKKIGINMRIKVSNENEWSAARRTPDQHQITATRGGAQPDIGAQLEQTFATGAAGNAGGVSDPKLDAMIRAQRAEAHPAKRRELIREATKYLSTDIAGGIGLNHEPGYIFWQPDLQGFHPSLWQGPQGTALENVWRER